jgi:lysozyme
MNTILGTDVSAVQGHNLDWSKIVASGVRFAFCKATEHTGYVDPTFAENARGGAAAGALIGSYHFFHADADVERQAESYFRVAAALTTLPPVLDLESAGHLHPDEVIRRAFAFVEATEGLWGRPCIVYTADWFWQKLGNLDAPELGRRLLWVSHYGAATPRIPHPWRDAGWAFWQFDGNGGRRFPSGVDADFNWFRGTEDDLRALCARRVDACFA